jgi:lipopolysaccharide/colanic/teichoic acid biosynthesis glycosyltransferase
LASANFINLVLNNSADADFYAFADQDDIWSPNKLASAIELLQKTGSDCYSSELLIWRHPLPLSSSIISQRWRIKKKLFGLFFAESAGCTYVMSRRAFLALKQRLLQIAEDSLLHHLFSHDLFTSAFLHSQGFKWYHDRGSMIYYRQHESNAWGADVMTIGSLQKRLRLLNSQHYHALLYLAWMDSPPGTIASQLWLRLCRLCLRDKIFLLRCALNSANLLSAKTAGLLFFIFFARKQKPTLSSHGSVFVMIGNKGFIVYPFIKRCFDSSFALLLLILFFPLLLCFYLLVGFRLGYPVLFRQQRPGYRSRPFWLLKFRTMTNACDASGTLLPDSQRLTPFGSWLRSTSIDELPALLNILRGEMSFIGPRPLLIQYLPLYSPEQARRHDVKPGFSGWAQINGRNAISWEEKFRLDVWYVDHQSFWLDLRIFLLTIWKVIRREGISAAGEATMAPFTGTAASE